MSRLVNLNTETDRRLTKLRGQLGLSYSETITRLLDEFDEPADQTKRKFNDLSKFIAYRYSNEPMLIEIIDLYRSCFLLSVGAKKKQEVLIDSLRVSIQRVKEK